MHPRTAGALSPVAATMFTLAVILLLPYALFSYPTPERAYRPDAVDRPVRAFCNGGSIQETEHDVNAFLTSVGLWL
jgi:hypothetical protein